MYSVLLTLHSIVRWLIVLAALASVGRALGGLRGGQAWTALDKRLGIIFTSAMDTQLLIGLLLYFFYSPITLAALRDMGGAMSQPGSRFFAVDHLFAMLIAVVLAHIGWARAKKASSDSAKFRQIAIFFGLAIVLVLLSIPWPFSSVARPWLRLG
ncbi:MAG: hypothetical protein WAV53_20710 [Anaerolineae bacterium]|jgi:cell division protein FtsW (lipid II flippase)